MLRTDTVLPSQTLRYFGVLPKGLWIHAMEENIELKEADPIAAPITVGKCGQTGWMTWSLPKNYSLPFWPVCFPQGS